MQLHPKTCHFTCESQNEGIYIDFILGSMEEGYFVDIPPFSVILGESSTICHNGSVWLSV
jgi:hypothetical protein